MARRRINSDWRRRSANFRTDRELVKEAANNPEALLRLMLKYRSMSVSYFSGILLKQKLAKDLVESTSIAEQVWSIVLKMIPDIIAEEWSRGAKPFRIILLESLHKAHLQHTKKISRQNLEANEPEAVADVGEFECRKASDLLRKSWSDLQRYEIKNKEKGSIAYTLLRLRGTYPDASIAELKDKIREEKGISLPNDNAVSKSLERARTLFANLLIADLRNWFPEIKVGDAEQLQKALRRLELLDPVLQSPYWRKKLGG